MTVHMTLPYRQSSYTYISFYKAYRGHKYKAPHILYINTNYTYVIIRIPDILHCK